MGSDLVVCILLTRLTFFVIFARIKVTALVILLVLLSLRCVNMRSCPLLRVVVFILPFTLPLDLKVLWPDRIHVCLIKYLFSR